MKLNKFVLSLLAGSTLVTPALALTFEITGATAFRTSTILSINNLYAAGGNYRFVHNKATTGDYINADAITFEGTITGLPGTTIIRCRFNGSIEGIRALAASPTFDPEFIKTSLLSGPLAPSPGTNVPGVSLANAANVEKAQAEMAFSDVDKALSPFANITFSGGPVGVVVFGIVASEGASAVTNVTTQQYKSLLGNGYMPLSYFTGVAADDNRLIFCTGRNDGSGTRTSYMAETGFGVTNPVNQYLVVLSTSSQITALQQVPAGGIKVPSTLDFPDLDIFDTADAIVADNTAASTIWGSDLNGNGGAFSGSVLRGHLGLDGDSVRVFDAAGLDLFGGVAQANIGLVSYISLNDAVTARTAGATLCAYNGVSLAVNAGTDGKEMTAADKSKVYEGTYTAWNFQQFYHLPTASDETVDLYNLIATAVPINLGSAGLKSADMQCARTADGGIINPIF